MENTQKHDFKAALDRCLLMKDDIQCYVFGDREFEAIQTALRLADRLQSGEVSDDTASAIRNEANYQIKAAGVGEVTSGIAIFQTMAAQMIEECE